MSGTRGKIIAMTGILTGLLRAAVARTNREHAARKPVRLPASLDELGTKRRHQLEELVILGVLLNLVAHADDVLSEEEEKRLRKVLSDRGADPKEAVLVIAAAREAAARSPDLHEFTREVNKHPYGERLRVLELLFQVGYADGELSHAELESIRRVAKLLWIAHEDFIDAKLRVRENRGIEKRRPL